MILRDYQADISDQIDAAWAQGASNILAVLPTGAGKTVCFSHKIDQTSGVRFAIAHRQELIGQISMALAKYGIKHNIIASKSLVKWIITLHSRKLGQHFYSPSSDVLVCGVRSLLRRADTLAHKIRRATLAVQDEGHHCVRNNEWGKAVSLFPSSCRWLFVTATPERADGRGLGRHASGVIDEMVVGVSMRDLINRGYLSDYRIFAPQTDIDLSRVPTGSTGDYSRPQLTAVVRESRIIGDVVDHYCRIAPGKLGVTFVTDVEAAQNLAEAYRAAGVPASHVTARTPDRERQEATEQLARGDLKQLVNVDIFGEGYDLPAIETISMARPTKSFPLYAQQFGRSLRIMDGKQEATIIDHVGNVMRHGLPDRARKWSLDDREKRSDRDPDDIPTRTCTSCLAVYEGYEKICPFCGFKYTPDPRATIEQVEGVLSEMDPDLLEQMRGEISRIDMPAHEASRKLELAGYPRPAIMGMRARHRERQEAQTELRQTIAQWCGYQRAAYQSDEVIQMRFWHTFGVDILGAQILGRRLAEELQKKLEKAIS